VVCAIFVSFTYVAGQMRGVGIVFSRFLEVDINVGVTIGMVIVFIYATLGGMKGITWTQVAQYWVLITAFLIPAIAISIRLTGQPIPQIGMGSQLLDEGVFLLDKLDQIHTDLGFAAYTETFTGSWDKLNVFCAVLALMVGTAGLPHVIVRFYTVKTVRAARWSAFWALSFIGVLYLTAPATAAFARYYMIQSLHGKSEQELPRWFNNWEKTGLIVWLDDSREKTGSRQSESERHHLAHKSRGKYSEQTRNDHGETDHDSSHPEAAGFSGGRIQHAVIEVVSHAGRDDQKQPAGRGQSRRQPTGGNQGNNPVGQLRHFRCCQHNDVPVRAR